MNSLIANIVAAGLISQKTFKSQLAYALELQPALAEFLAQEPEFDASAEEEEAIENYCESNEYDLKQIKVVYDSWVRRVRVEYAQHRWYRTKEELDNLSRDYQWHQSDEYPIKSDKTFDNFTYMDRILK